jgi:vitamin B12 transporter
LVVLCYQSTSSFNEEKGEFRKLMRKIIFNLLLFTLSFISVSINVKAESAGVSGHITDPQGKAIAGAVITLYERDNRTRLTTLSDSNGAYSFERLAQSEYVMEVEAKGFFHSVQNLRIDTNIKHNIQLEVIGLKEEVVITASSTAQSVDEVSKAVTLVDASEIELRNESSIVESLRNVPGLRVVQLKGYGRLAQIRTRGLRTEDTSILVDGFRFRDAATGKGDAGAFLSELLFINTDRIEVLRGSGSSLYGTNAIGGVVNVLTDQGGGQTHGDIQLEGGSLGLFRGRAKISGGLDEDRLVYSAGLAHLNVSKGIDDNDAYRNTSGQGFVKFNLTPSTSLSGRIFAGDTFSQLDNSPNFFLPNASVPDTVEVRAIPLAKDQQRLLEANQRYILGNATFIPGYDHPFNRQATRFFSGVTSFTQRVSEEFSYRIGYQHLTTKRKYRYLGGFSLSNNMDGNIDTLNTRADIKIGKYNLITAGYEFENEAYNDIKLDRNFNLLSNSKFDVAQRSHTAFIQDQLFLMDRRLQLSIAGRIQNFNLSQPKFGDIRSDQIFKSPPTAYTADGSISYLFSTSGTKLRAHVGNGYRVPSLYERFSIYGDSNLRPDRSIAFDTGIDQSFKQGRLRTSATYFYTRLQEVIDFLFIASDLRRPYGGYTNTGGGLARGVELSVETMPIESLRLTTSYTYTNADQNRSGIVGFNRAFIISDHMFSLTLNQRIGRRIDVTFDLFAASDYAYPAFYSESKAIIFDGPIKADLGASYTLPLGDDRRSLRFYGKVDNIFDRTYFEQGFYAPGAAFVGGLTYKF